MPVFIWHALVDLMFLRCVNKLARAETKWIQACDKRLARLVSYIHHTWETQHNIADEDCFKTLISQETLKTRSQHQVDCCAYSEVTRSCQ